MNRIFNAWRLRDESSTWIVIYSHLLWYCWDEKFIWNVLQLFKWQRESDEDGSKKLFPHSLPPPSFTKKHTKYLKIKQKKSFSHLYAALNYGSLSLALTHSLRFIFFFQLSIILSSFHFLHNVKFSCFSTQSLRFCSKTFSCIARKFKHNIRYKT